LFADHEFNNRHPQVKHAVSKDQVFGDTGLSKAPFNDPKKDPFAQNPGNDTIVVYGSDLVDAGGQAGDSIIIAGNGSVHLTVQDWLRATFPKPTTKNIQDAIDKALMQPCTFI
jgi:hypothetical protein